MDAMRGLVALRVLHHVAQLGLGGLAGREVVAVEEGLGRVDEGVHRRGGDLGHLELFGQVGGRGPHHARHVAEDDGHAHLRQVADVGAADLDVGAVVTDLELDGVPVDAAFGVQLLEVGLGAGEHGPGARREHAREVGGEAEDVGLARAGRLPVARGGPGGVVVAVVAAAGRADERCHRHERGQPACRPSPDEAHHVLPGPDPVPT
jgi:hypothetical protein